MELEAGGGAAMDKDIATLMSLTDCDPATAAAALRVAEMDVAAALSMVEDFGASNFRLATVQSVSAYAETPVRTRHSNIPRRPLPAGVRDGSIIKLRSVCKEALKKNLWVFLFFHDNSFQGWLAQNALWEHSALSVLNDFALCCDLNREESYGLRIFQEYHLTATGPVQAIILNPVTQSKCFEVPIQYLGKGRRIDPEEIINAVVLAVAETEPPNFLNGSTSRSPSPADEEDEEASAAPAGIALPASKEAPRDVRDVTGGDPPSREGTSPAAVRAELPEVVSLQPFEAPAGPESLKLRLQFPKGPLDVVLSKATPLQSLLGYCSHRLHMEHREKYPLRPREPYFLGGFPPQRLEMPASPTATLGECSALRNGVKITATADVEASIQQWNEKSSGVCP